MTRKREPRLEVHPEAWDTILGKGRIHHMPAEPNYGTDQRIAAALRILNAALVESDDTHEGYILSAIDVLNGKDQP